MKSLLKILAIIALSTGIAQAQPVASDARFSQQEGSSFTGSVATFVTGGMQPYTFLQVPPDPEDYNPNIRIIFYGSDKFSVSVPYGFTGDTQFQYQVIDQNQELSNPATVTVKFGQEKA